MQTLSHQVILEEGEAQPRRPPKKFRKTLLTEMDHKIMSIYKAPLPSSKPGKKGKGSFNLFVAGDT